MGRRPGLLQHKAKLQDLFRHRASLHLLQVLSRAPRPGQQTGPMAERRPGSKLVQRQRRPRAELPHFPRLEVLPPLLFRTRQHSRPELAHFARPVKRAFTHRHSRNKNLQMSPAQGRERAHAAAARDHQAAALASLNTLASTSPKRKCRKVQRPQVQAIPVKHRQQECHRSLRSHRSQ